MLEFKKKEELENEIKNAKRKTTICSVVRGVLGVDLVLFLVCLLSLKDYVRYGLISAGFFIAFLGAVIASQPVYRRASMLEAKRKCYLRHEQRRGKNFSHFADNGSEFKDKEDYKLSDLDIFGAKSLYQYLSEAKTPSGRKALAGALKNKTNPDKSFTKMTAALAESEDSLDLEASLALFEKGSLEYKNTDFASSLKEPASFKISYFLPFLSFILMIVYIALMIPLKWNYYVPLAFLFANVLLSKLLIRNEMLQKDAYGLSYAADLYYDLSCSVMNTNIGNERYNELKEIISKSLLQMKKARGIFTLLKVRRNLFVNIILNMICSFDFYVMAFVFLKNKRGTDLSPATEALAELETALSLKNIGFDNEAYCIPEDSSLIEADEMYHPFVKGCVANSLSLDGGIVLTGSNMSGKTTFMRTLGVCQILKNAGGIVPAKSFRSPELGIHTSLRANDMLQEGISTFYAEIKRMKKITEAVKEKPVLVLVDEIFKGTNAKERIDASLRVISNLNSHKAFFIVSTHDYEICEAEGIKNYHFEEQYQDDGISFDYHLREGAGEKGNAMYLLKMMGIIEE